MNADTEKLCMEEIDHLVFDNDKKVTVTHISNNWSSVTKDSVAVLEKWLKNNSSNKQIAKEYLIRGIDLNGNPVITIVPEKKLATVEKVCPNHTRTLYSVEVSSINGKSLNIPEPTTTKFISLKIKSEKRNVKVNAIVVPSTEKSMKKEPEVAKKPSNIFGTAQSKPKDVKTEKDSEKSSKDIKVKEEKKSPTKASPKKNQTAKGLKAPPGIASFFASKPSTSKVTNVEKSVSEATTKIESVKIKEELAESEVNENGNKNNSKRTHSNVSDSNDEVKSSEKNQKTQAKKKIKLEPKSARSRLMQICDSSSDEEDSTKTKETAMETDEEPEVKKEKENKTPSPQKSDSKQGNRSTGDSKKRRAKVKKMVTRTYEDEDGFINTVRELEEVSCSEEEAEAAPPPKKAASTTNNSSSTASKKKISPPVGKKQGSILSFFGKK